MCDTMVVVREDAVLFAKNSDRDPNEAQYLHWRPRRSYPPNSKVTCTYITIPQVRETHALLLSRPYWMWGGEMGANEHGVVIGNEAVFTNQPLNKIGLLGMDLIRLALERAETAAQAVEVITSLLETHGQGGGCGHEHRSFSYHNSFLIADPRGAILLETAGSKWAAESVTGVRSISNGLTIPGFRDRYTDRIKSRVSACAVRQHHTQSLLDPSSGPADLMAILRDHGAGRDAPAYNWINGAMAAPCMHAGGLVAASQTTASWVAELRPDGPHRHWVTATAAPCTGLFKPVQIDDRLELGTPPTDQPDDSLWWRHERLHRMVMTDPNRLLPLYASERNELEARWLAHPPKPADAFAEGDRLLAEWTQRVESALGRDLRPAYVKRYWATRTKKASA